MILGSTATSLWFLSKGYIMTKVKMASSQKNALPVNVAPTALLKIWLNGSGDFSSVSRAISTLSQKKSGTQVEIDGICFVKDGAVIKLVEPELEGLHFKTKAANLIVCLTQMLSNKTAKQISTMKDAA